MVQRQVRGWKEKVMHNKTSSGLYYLVEVWQRSINNKFSEIVKCDCNLGSLSTNLSGVTGCAANDMNTVNHYGKVAEKIIKKSVPRGKAWRKVLDRDMANLYANWEC